MSAIKKDNKPEEKIPHNNSEHNNVIQALYEVLYENTDPLPRAWRVFNSLQHQRAIFRVMDPEIIIYISSKGQKDTKVYIELPGKFRIGPVVCPRRFVEQDYLEAFECSLPPDWENRDLAVTQYLSNIRQIVEEEREKSN
jgi:hypothetical protein